MSVIITNGDGYLNIQGLKNPVGLLKNNIVEVTTEKSGVQNEEAVVIKTIQTGKTSSLGIFKLKFADITSPIAATIEDLMTTVLAYSGSNSEFMSGYAQKAPLTVTLVPGENVIPHGLEVVPFLAWVEKPDGKSIVFSSLLVDDTNVTVLNDSEDTYTNYILKILY